jgi:hypothetical protein
VVTRDMNDKQKTTPEAVTELYRRKRGKNMAVLGLIAFVFVLFFVITIVRMA